MSRASFGNERYEKAEFQERVAKVYKELKSDDWRVSNNIIIYFSEPRKMQERFLIPKLC